MPGVTDWIARHRKLVVFIAGAALTAAIQVWGTSNPYVSIAILAATGLGIYQAPNKDAPYPGVAGPVTPPPVLVTAVPAAVVPEAGVPPSAAPSAQAAGTAGPAPSGTA